MELFKASKQWANRPADERFGSLRELYNATHGYYESAVEAEVAWRDLRVEAIAGDVRLVGRETQPAVLTNWAFGQLSARVGAPANYLRELPATLAAQNLNHGLKARADELEQSPASTASKSAQLLIHRNGSMLVRALTSDRYSRIWNHEVAVRLLDLEQQGWEPARADIRTTDDDFPALYASDHDMFAFIRNPNLTVEEKGSSGAVYRGVIAENSEVGASALKLTRFLYREMCGNHIIWGASELVDVSVRHVGDVHERMKRWELVLNEYAAQGASEEEAMIERARTIQIADTKEGVLDKLFGIRQLNISRRTLEASYDAVVPEQDGDARTVWGMVQGITRHSQTLPFADKRNDLDRAAGRVLERIKF